MYEEIKKMIEEAGEDIIDFRYGVSEKWIQLAEERLNIRFPESYKWWLRNYGGGGIYGEEIYGIYEQDFDTVVGGDIVYMHEINKKHPIYPSNALVIGRGIDQVFYFNLAIVPEDGEYPIYEFFTGEKYADNFIEFLKRRILED